MNLKSSPTRLPGMPLSRDPQVFDFDPDILVDIKPKPMDPGSTAYRDDVKELRSFQLTAN